jgi:hypothetical protein
MEVLSLGEGFGEAVGNLIYCSTIMQIDDLLLNQLLEKMHVDVSVFVLLMMNQVLRDLEFLFANLKKKLFFVELTSNLPQGW